MFGKRNERDQQTVDLLRAENLREEEEKKRYEREQTKRRLYQRVFGTEEGQEVLTDIVNECKFFDSHLKTAEDVALHNFSKKLLYNAGMWDESSRLEIIKGLYRLKNSMPDKSISIGVKHGR